MYATWSAHSEAMQVKAALRIPVSTGHYESREMVSHRSTACPEMLTPPTQVTPDRALLTDKGGGAMLPATTCKRYTTSWNAIYRSTHCRLQQGFLFAYITAAMHLIWGLESV